MIRAVAIVRRPAVKPERIADVITLDHGERHRRRVALSADGGLAFLLDLEKAQVVEDGDALKLEDGRLVAVKAAPERLVEIRAGSALRLMKVVWHIGNRHVPAEVTEDAVYIGYDHVLVDMVRGLGASAEIVERPFRPERGAYAGGGHHHGHHHHGEDGRDHPGLDGHGHDHG